MNITLSKGQTYIAAILLVVIGVASRLLPHPWNTTPLTAIALFSSAYLGLRYSFGIFLVTMVITDFFLGVYKWQIMLAVYGSFIIAMLLGLLLKEKKNFGKVFGATLASSVLFFLITNWAVWQFGTMYVHTFSGLILSYTMAIPFFKHSLVGDMFYTSVFFGCLSFALSYIKSKQKTVQSFQA